ncbi:zinc finger protein 629-like [Sebastes umbrosus]|uniref:zinc finger protein 629-like n=1 Tax=Sebastes umbrosus TaxID=72105 RepID=UPI00189F5854|nr:zinc finger protein 629-like [Sebastes umbrosus]
MASYVKFHTQLASIMEVLANAAVAEICQLVEDGFASLRLEVSRSQRENLELKSTLQSQRENLELKSTLQSQRDHLELKSTLQSQRENLELKSTLQSQRENLELKSTLRLMEVRSGEPSPLQVEETCTRKDHVGEDSSTISKRKVKSTMLEKTDTQGSQLVVVTEQPVEPEVVVIKKERLEEELEDHQTASNISIGPQYLSLAAESDRPRNVEAEIPRVSLSGRYDNRDFPRPEAQQQEEEGVEEASTPCRYSHPAHRGGGPNRAREMTDLTKEEEKHVVDSIDSLSAESSSSKVPDDETAPMATLDSEPSPPNSGVKGLCGAAADWRGEAVKLEAEPSWSEAFRTCNPLLSVTRNECVSNSTLTNTSSHHIEREAAELDTSSLDSSSFDDLFSSPEVARSLTAPHKHSSNGVTSTEEPLSSHLTSSFPFQSSESSFGNCSMSDSLTVSSFSIASSDSRSRSFPSSTEQEFSCHQCCRLFSTSRDLVVHQRSHAGERIYHCHLCRKPFIHPHQLNTTSGCTREKPFSCTQCGKRFSQSSHIKRHMSVHTGEKRYSCSLCGKRFSQACSLKVHQTVHTGERPYSCTKCGKSFSVLGNLVRHHSVHIGNEQTHKAMKGLT